MSALEIQDLRTGYGAQEVLKGVDLAVRTGELCALLGLNGSGKSTLLRAVCGLIPARWAALTVDGHDLGPMHERQRARWLSYIPQRSSAGTGLTVLEVVLMGCNPRLGLFESTTAADRERARGALRRVGLDGFEERPFDRISEGQRQLAVFARALVQDAPVMLLDEPDSALDFVHRHQVLGQISALVRSEGKSGLVTLHDPNFAMAYCDRLLLLKEGRLAGDVAVGASTAEELAGALSRLYGPVRVLEADGERCMLRRR